MYIYIYICIQTRHMYLSLCRNIIFTTNVIINTPYNIVHTIFPDYQQCTDPLNVGERERERLKERQINCNNRAISGVEMERSRCSTES